MSKFRYEVEKRNCKWNENPNYVMFNWDSKYNHVYDIFIDEGHDKACEEAFISCKIFKEDFIEVPIRVNYNEVKMINNISDVWLQREDCYPAKRIGRMFPRHRQQVIYSEVDL